MSGVTWSGDFKLANSAGASHCCLILPLTVSMVGVGAGVGVGVGGGVVKSLAPCVPSTVIILPLFKWRAFEAGSGVAPGAGEAPGASVAAPAGDCVGTALGCGDKPDIGAMVGLPTAGAWVASVAGEAVGAFGLACATSVTDSFWQAGASIKESTRRQPPSLMLRGPNVR